MRTAALENVTPPDPSAAGADKLKAALSKANPQAAAFKKQLQGKQSEEGQKAAAQQKEHEKLVQENADLKRAITLSEKKAKLLGMGYRGRTRSGPCTPSMTRWRWSAMRMAKFWTFPSGPLR